MKAIDVRYNQAIHNERDLGILRRAKISYSNVEEAKRKLRRNGCPSSLNRAFNRECDSECQECWSQRPNEGREEE